MMRLIVVLALVMLVSSVACAQDAPVLEFLGLDPVWVQPLGSDAGYVAGVASLRLNIPLASDRASVLEGAVLGALSLITFDLVVAHGEVRPGLSMPLESLSSDIVRIGIGYVQEGWALTIRGNVGLGG